MRRFDSRAGVMAVVAAVGLVCFAAAFGGTARATPLPNGASIEARTFNDCGLSTLTVTNNFPASVEITDAMHPACLGFANLHSFSFSEDGGATAAAFANNSSFRFGADFTLSGPGEGEGGLRLSPWWSQLVDGRFMANATSGEIAVFGGRLPFYSFTVNHGISYVKGTTIRFELTYLDNGLSAADPATVQYRAIYGGNTYDSPVLSFDMGNPGEDPPYGLWGMLNDGRAGGYFQVRANTGVALTANWSNVEFTPLGTPDVNAATIEARTFNDCALSTLTTTNNYPTLVEITDEMNPACLGFANLHSFSFSEDGGVTPAVFNNVSIFRFGADFTLSGAGTGEGGLRLSPWWSQFVDGRFMANATTGEIACFGGRLPFYSFTVNHGITYVKGTTIHMELTYNPNGLSAADPATIQYRVVSGGSTYDSPVLTFDEGNAGEDPPFGLWGMLNNGRAGGYFQVRANTGAALTATWGNITFGTCLVTMDFTFQPETLNLKAQGNFVTGYLEPPAGYAAEDIDVSSILLNGTVAVADGAPTSIGDFDGDGVADLKVKFSRSEVLAVLSAGDDVQVSVSGTVAGDCFQGSDMIRVKDSGLHSPPHGAVLVAGTQAEVIWEVDSHYPRVDLISSFDGGATWNIEARRLQNTGTYQWTVPAVLTDQASLAVVVIHGENADLELLAELGQSSATFSITTPTDALNRGNVFALHGVSPNPARLGITVNFSLASSEPAKLEVFDVRGRQVADADVGTMGPGMHSLTFGKEKNLAAGVYMVRLTKGDRSLRVRATVIQ